MSAVACPFEPEDALLVPAYVRASGQIRANFVRHGDRTSLARAYEQGGLRLRCPKVAGGCEAVIMNTAGGIVGGDRAAYAFEVEGGAEVTITTPAAEKVYRAQSIAAEVGVRLRLGPAAKLEWMPQETILFDGARLVRHLDVAMAADASLIIVESVVFGRLAQGETLTRGLFHDRWRICRQGKLVFAEDVYLADDIASKLDRAACGKGARMAGIILHVASDAESKLEAVRGMLEHATAESGASAWNGMLVARFVSASPGRVRRAIVATLEGLRRRDAPRVWQ